MAILSPSELPVCLKVASDPLKSYVLAQLGHGTVDVELSESQLEIALRTTGDWIAGYFPREQRLAVFYTQPLKPTYPMPDDAYWIQEVSWFPTVSNIDLLFSHEAYLYCVGPDFKVLDKDGVLQPIGDWCDHWRATTPYGYKRLKIKKHQIDHDLPKVQIDYDGGSVVATSNHILMANGKWLEFGEVKENDALVGVKTTVRVQHIVQTSSRDAISIRALGAGCYFGCLTGNPVLIH